MQATRLSFSTFLHRLLTYTKKRISNPPTLKISPSILAITLLAGLTLLRFFPLLQDKTLFFGDNYSLMIPGKLFTAYWIREGLLPLWNPTLFAGLSWIGDINQSIFYPTTLLFTWLNPAVALNITVIAHIFISALGMYLLAKFWTKSTWASAFAALIWAFSPQLTGSINNLSTLQSMTWAPWILWAGVLLPVKPWAKFALIIAGVLQVGGGYPQHVMYSFILGFVLMLWYHRNSFSNIQGAFRLGLQWLLPTIAILGITTIIWWPFLETLKHSTRVTQSDVQSQLGSLHPAEILKIIHPYIFDHPAQGIKWGPTWNKAPNVFLYITWFGLFMIGWSFLKKRIPDDIFFAALCLVTLFIALGSYIPGFEILQNVIPLLKITRGPSIVLMIPALILPLWVALSWRRLSISRELHTRILGIKTVIALGAISAWTITQIAFPSLWSQVNQLTGNRLALSAFHTEARDRVLVENASSTLAVTALLACIALVLWRYKKYSLLVIVLGLDMIINTQGVLFFAPSSVYPDWKLIQREHAFVEFLPTVERRFLTRNYNDPYTDFGAYWEALSVRQPLTDSYVDEKELEEFNHLERLRLTYTPDWNMPAGLPVINGFTTLLPQDVSERWNAAGSNSINNLDTIKLDNPLLAQWAVGYYLVDPFYPQISEIPYQSISKSKYWEIYKLPALSRFRYGNNEAIEIKTYEETPNFFLLEYNNPTNNQELIIADRYDNNWRAQVNEQDVEIKNYQGMRKIPSSSGENKVVFSYKPSAWRFGLFITLGSTAAVLLWWLVESRKRRLHAVSKK